MDSDINSMNNSGKSLYYLKNATKILLPVFVFSYIFSPSSSLLLVRSYDYLVSNYSIKLFSYTSERNYIFLLCNGILVLIIQTSGLISKIAPVEPSSIKAGAGRIDDEYRVEKVDDHQPEDVRKLDVIQEIKGTQNGGHDVDEDGVIMAAELVERELEEYEEEKDYDEKEEEEQSTDELNKRCEEFIKKMKKEILRVHEIS